MTVKKERLETAGLETFFNTVFLCENQRGCAWKRFHKRKSGLHAEQANGGVETVGRGRVGRNNGGLDAIGHAEPGCRINDMRITDAADFDKLFAVTGGGSCRVLQQKH